MSGFFSSGVQAISRKRRRITRANGRARNACNVSGPHRMHQQESSAGLASDQLGWNPTGHWYQLTRQQSQNQGLTRHACEHVLSLAINTPL